MADPWRYFTAERLAEAARVPIENAADYWPRLVAQMELAGLADDMDVYLAMIGTVAKESASQFTAVREAFWLDEAARWAEYTRRGYDGGPNYHGRGGIQHTHLYNYRSLWPKIAALWGAEPSHPDFDLVSNPDKLLDPDFSAAADVIYFRDKRALPTVSWPQGYSLLDAAHARDWEWVRRLVLGGADPDGVARLERVAAMLGKENTMPTIGTFNPNTPTYLQRNDYTCSIGSVIWMLRSLGLSVTPEDAHDAMVPKYVRSDVGLLDASGAGMVEVLRDKWDVDAVNDGAATFDKVVASAGVEPVAIGLRDWGGKGKGHWSAVRGFDGERLVLANPAGTGPTFGQQTLTRSEFEARGGASMVTIPIGAAPPVVVDPRDARIAELEAQVAELQTIRGHLTVSVAGALQAAVDELKRHAA
jgi:predicted chitinase